MSLTVPLTDEKRAQIGAALLSGLGVREVARQFDVSPSVISKIKGEITSGVFVAARTEKKEAELVERKANLYELTANYLCENLTTLAAQAVVARDGNYLKQYSPESLAILHGVMADKAIRILEAAAAAQPLPGPGPAELK